MRNDIVNTKVTYDEENLYFYVRTEESLTPATDPAWMRLFIDTQEATENSVDWEEFEYVINRVNPTDSKAYVEKSTGEWNWEQVGEIDYKVQDNVLQLSVPRKMLGFNKDQPVRFNIKWSDNMQTEGDIMDFYINGDVAPGGRFMFSFSDREMSEADNGKVILTILIIAVGVVVAVIGLLFVAKIKKRKRITS